MQAANCRRVGVGYLEDSPEATMTMKTKSLKRKRSTGRTNVAGGGLPEPSRRDDLVVPAFSRESNGETRQADRVKCKGETGERERRRNGFVRDPLREMAT